MRPGTAIAKALNAAGFESGQSRTRRSQAHASSVGGGGCKAHLCDPLDHQAPALPGQCGILVDVDSVDPFCES